MTTCKREDCGNESACEACGCCKDHHDADNAKRLLVTLICADEFTTIGTTAKMLGLSSKDIAEVFDMGKRLVIKAIEKMDAEGSIVSDLENFITSHIKPS